jgi:hypothetical protein
VTLPKKSRFVKISPVGVPIWQTYRSLIKRKWPKVATPGEEPAKR